MSERRLSVARSAAVDDDGSPAVDIDIDEIYYQLSNERIDGVFDRIRRFDLPPVAGLPMFDLLWPRFAGSFNAYHHAPTGLSNTIVLYRELDDRIDWTQVDVLNCRGVDDYHLALVHDVADGKDVAVEGGDPPSNRRAVGFLRGLVSVVLFLVDGIFSLVTSPFVETTDDAVVAFVPHLNRIGSMLPVIDAATYPYTVVAPVATLEWLKSRVEGRWSDAHELDIVPLGRYVSLSVLFREWRTAVGLVVEEGIRGRFRTALLESVEAEFDVRIPRTVDQSLGNVYVLHLSALLYLHRARRLTETTSARRIVVGSQSTRQQCILRAADERGLRTFHVPHTVPLPQEALPRTDTVQIVPSTASKTYLERAIWAPDSLDIAPLGRPAFAELAKSRGSTPDLEEPISILLATQPYDGGIRREFVEWVLDGLGRNPRAASVTIKIHPNESTAFYQQYTDKSDGTVPVTLADKDLIEQIKRADVTAVISTNVGVESLSLGTPVVAINCWEPRIRRRPYQINVPMPVLQDRDDVVKWFATLTLDRIADLRADETTFFDENYMLDDAPERIAEFVRSDDA